MALIVEDPEDSDLPDQVKNAQDVLMFVQYMNLGTLASIAQQSGDGHISMSVNAGMSTTYRLVNGHYQPTVHMQPGEWQRWRVVYASWLRDPLDFTIDNDLRLTRLTISPHNHDLFSGKHIDHFFW